MSQYFPKKYEHFGGNVKVELDLSNYITKSDLKKETGLNASKFAKKTNLASLKSDVDELDVYKLKYVPFDLSKLSGVVKMMLLKKLHMINWLRMLMLFRQLILMI